MYKKRTFPAAALLFEVQKLPHFFPLKEKPFLKKALRTVYE